MMSAQKQPSRASFCGLGSCACIGVVLIVIGIAAKAVLPTMCATDGSEYSYVETLSSDGNTRHILPHVLLIHAWLFCAVCFHHVLKVSPENK